MSLAPQTIAPGDGFEFNPDRVLDGNHRTCLELKSGKRRANLVHLQRIIAVHEHVPSPLTHAHDKHLDLEVNGRLPTRRRMRPQRSIERV